MFFFVFSQVVTRQRAEDLGRMPIETEL
jgi:hypothetical protein